MSLHDEPAPQELLEEYVDNRPTGVESEEQDAGVTHDPWDPEAIRIHTKTFSLHQVVEMIDDGDIDLAPDFQRQYVWKDAQRWGLIESLLLGIPLPSFYFNEDETGRFQVVDGVQRLTTIHRFFKGQFALGKLAYLDLEGSRYEELDAVSRRRLKLTQFVIHVIDPQTPYRVKFDVFKRINTGGSPLSAQEIRHCMSRERSRSFLAELVALPEFQAAMGKSVLNHPRMADREIALRLVAFHIIPVEQYRSHDSLDAFLGRVTELIDKLDDSRLSELKQLAVQALRNAEKVFGEFAFRKWSLGFERKNPINRALVESWGTALATRELVSEEAAYALSGRDRALMTHDAGYLDSITGGTGDPNKVETRMRKAEELVQEVIG
ncbi:MAG: DUF262 domain-containing protein [Myxococcota bacterium]|jgi:hypothetical protein|nr:DUF262 domain-containing protein [Myxococcota bacterium]